MVKKIAIVVILVVAFSLALVAPVFADQPIEPGCFGKIVSGQTETDEGRAYFVHLTKQQTDDGTSAYGGKNVGQEIKLFKADVCGIPPKNENAIKD